MPLPIDNHQPSLALTQFLPLTGIFLPRDPGPPTPGLPLGSIRTFAGNFALGGSATAEGQVLVISQSHQALFSLLGFTYGGNGTSSFALPDLDGRTMIGAGPGIGVGAAIGLSGIALSQGQLPASLGGSAQPIDNYQPSLPITYLIRAEDGGAGGVDFIGQIAAFAGNFAPTGFLEAAGQILQIADYATTLWPIIGTTYGGNGISTFRLPDLRGRTIVGASSELPLGATVGQPQATLSNTNLPASVGGSGQSIDNREPSLALTYLISLAGIFPSPSSGGVDPTEQYFGEVVAFAGGTAPPGWAKAEGQLLPISQNTPLFSLLGFNYGGNGTSLFALPDLRNRTAIGTGDAADIADVVGSTDATILSANIPDLVITGTGGADTLYGADGNDTLDGADGNDVINAGAGANLLHGSAGIDYVAAIGNLNRAFGDDGNDQLYFSGHQNQLSGGAGNDWLGAAGDSNALVGGAGDEVWIGASGNSNTLVGGDGNDPLFANGTGNSLHGETGADWLGASGNGNAMYGAVGNEWMGATGNGNYLIGGDGDDTLSSVGSNVLYGEAGNDWVGCSGNNNFLSGAEGNDYIAASGKFNRLDGGAGNDTLFAGANAHDHATFAFHPAYSVDSAFNFVGQLGDRIDIRGWGIANYAALTPYLHDSAAGLVIAFDAGNQLTINGVHALDPSWIVFV